MILALIIIFTALAYSIGLISIFRGEYKPSVYSRLIWLLLAINGLAGVITLKNDAGTVAFTIIQTLGSLLIFLAAFRFSILKFGKIEAISTGLLLLSGAVWAFGDVPAVNVAVGLIAHFIGALPTFARVYKNAKSENVLFWLFCAIATSLAFATAGKANFQDYMYPLYFALFNIGMALASARRYILKTPS